MTTRNNTKPKTIIKQNTGSTINEVIDANENQLLSSKSSVKIITLIISDTSQMKIDLKLAVKGYPNILSILNLNTCELYLPDWMDIKNLKDYFLYVKLSYDSDEQEINQSVSQIKFNFKKLIQLVNYFENDVIFEHMIKMNIIPNINIDNCISLINDAFNYYTEIKENIVMKNLWLGLIEILTNFLTENFMSYLNEESLTRIKKLNKVILNNVINTFLLNPKNANLSKKEQIKVINVIGILYDITIAYNENINQSVNDEVFFNLFECISDDIVKNESLNLLNKNNKLEFIINLHELEDNNYQEKEIDFKLYSFVFVVQLSKESNELSISLQVKPKIKEITFISIKSLIHKLNEYSSWNSIVLSDSDKISLYKIQKVSSFKQDDIVISIEVNVKEAFLINYYYKNFNKVCQSRLLYKIKPEIFIYVISYLLFTQKQRTIKDDSIITSIINWLSDIENSKNSDYFYEILENFNWETIPLGKIFEFIIKLPQFLSKKSIENMIISAIYQKTYNKFIFFQNSNRADNLKLSSEKGNSSSKKRDSSSNDGTGMLIHLISYFLVNIFECSKRIQYSKTIFDLKKIIMQLKIPYRTESKKKEEEDNKEEIIENAIKESQIENLDNDEKVTIQSIHNVPQEKEKDTNDFAKKSNTNAYFNKSKKSYINYNYNNTNNSRYEEKPYSNYILEETFHKLSNNSMNKSINHITTNNSFSSKLSEKLSFNNQTKKTPKYCFSPTKVGLKKQKTKVDIFFNNGVYTPSTGRGKSTASQQSNLSRSNSSNKMYFNSSSKGAKREKKVVLNLIPKVG